MGRVPSNPPDHPRLPGPGRASHRGGRPGKLIGTARVIREHSEALEADLLEHFGVDLLDLWRGRLSLRRVGVLINSLMRKPGRSVLLAELDESAQWGGTEHLLARVSDALELSNFLFIKANSDGTADLPIPEPIPRPGTLSAELPPVEENFVDGTELSDFFARMNSL